MTGNSGPGSLSWLTAFRNCLKTGVLPRETAADAANPPSRHASGVEPPTPVTSPTPEINADNTEAKTSPAPSAAIPENTTADADVPLPTKSIDNDATSDPLDNKPWLDLAKDCLALFEEMDRNRDFFETQGERQLADHIGLRLQEILERSGLEVIDTGGPFGRNLHQPDRSAAGTAPELLAVEIRSPGFRIGRRILRRARVRLLGSTDEPPSPGAINGEAS